jgi:hypothetical protein
MRRQRRALYISYIGSSFIFWIVCLNPYGTYNTQKSVFSQCPVFQRSRASLCFVETGQVRICRRCLCSGQLERMFPFCPLMSKPEWTRKKVDVSGISWNRQLFLRSRSGEKEQSSMTWIKVVPLRVLPLSVSLASSNVQLLPLRNIRNSLEEPKSS